MPCISTSVCLCICWPSYLDYPSPLSPLFFTTQLKFSENIPQFSEGEFISLCSQILTLSSRPPPFHSVMWLSIWNFWRQEPCLSRSWLFLQCLCPVGGTGYWVTSVMGSSKEGRREGRREGGEEPCKPKPRVHHPLSKDGPWGPLKTRDPTVWYSWGRLQSRG